MSGLGISRLMRCLLCSATVVCANACPASTVRTATAARCRVRSPTARSVAVECAAVLFRSCGDITAAQGTAPATVDSVNVSTLGPVRTAPATLALPARITGTSPCVMLELQPTHTATLVAAPTRTAFASVDSANAFPCGATTIATAPTFPARRTAETGSVSAASACAIPAGTHSRPARPAARSRALCAIRLARCMASAVRGCLTRALLPI